MAINEKEFYASHEISYDIEKMQIEYTKRVINQAKIEVLIELQTEIEEVPKYCMTQDATFVYRKAEEYISDINNLIQQKIDKLKED